MDGLGWQQCLDSAEAGRWYGTSSLVLGWAWQAREEEGGRGCVF